MEKTCECMQSGVLVNNGNDVHEIDLATLQYKKERHAIIVSYQNKNILRFRNDKDARIFLKEIDARRRAIIRH